MCNADPALCRVLVERNRIFWCHAYTSHQRKAGLEAGHHCFWSKSTRDSPGSPQMCTVLWRKDPIPLDQDPMQSWIRRCTLWGVMYSCLHVEGTVSNRTPVANRNGLNIHFLSWYYFSLENICHSELHCTMCYTPSQNFMALRWPEAPYQAGEFLTCCFALRLEFNDFRKINFLSQVNSGSPLANKAPYTNQN